MGRDSAGAAQAVAATVLRGPDHPALDGGTVRAVGDRAALGISAGRHPKVVAAVDDNEDAAALVQGPGGTLLTVADGHFGADASVAAVEAVTAGARKLLARPVADPRTAMADVADVAGHAVSDARAAAVGDRADSATALGLVYVVDRSAWCVTFGDVGAVRVRGNRPRVVSRAGPFLTGSGAAPEPRRERLRAGDYLVTVSAGVIDHLGRSWPDVLTDAVRRADAPAGAVDAILSRAMDRAAGDHLSCAALRY